MQHLTIRNAPGTRPIIHFDGDGGIYAREIHHFELYGFEIVGANQRITKDEADNDRLLKSNYFSGKRKASHLVISSPHLTYLSRVSIHPFFLLPLFNSSNFNESILLQFQHDD